MEVRNETRHVTSPLSLSLDHDSYFTTKARYEMTIHMESSLKAQYDAQGYVIVPGLISDGDRSVLEEACEHVIAKTRSGEWTHRRTVGKQFPPYGDDHPDSWGVQHVMHPDLGEPAFAKWYTSSALIDVIQQLLECQEEHLQMGEHHPIYRRVICG